MCHLFQNWREVGRRVQRAGKIALFLDFDGTLARLRPRPDEVTLDGATRQALAALTRNPRFRICVVSGRRRSEIRTLIGLPGIRYLGLHGWEGRGSTLDPETMSSLRVLSTLLEGCLADLPRVWIENKEFAFAIHHGAAIPEERCRALAILGNIIRPLAPRFRITSGKKVWEILPRELRDKGAAIRRQLFRMSGDPVAVYVGDDQLDEPAFTALRGEITVLVGRRSSRAVYRLGGVAQVGMFLRKLAREAA